MPRVKALCYSSAGKFFFFILFRLSHSLDARRVEHNTDGGTKSLRSRSDAKVNGRKRGAHKYTYTHTHVAVAKIDSHLNSGTLNTAYLRRQIGGKLGTNRAGVSMRTSYATPDRANLLTLPSPRSAVNEDNALA
jgi:hypothetical protein